MNEISSHELYALLVPLTEERLIVPRACVAEVVTWQQPDKMEGAPAWYLGTISWNGRAVPVISFSLRLTTLALNSIRSPSLIKRGAFG